MIDPQMQANKWLRRRAKEQHGNDNEVKIIKPTMDSKIMSRTLETSMNFGYSVIFEDANETFDPMLDPILSKQLKKEGAEWLIKFADGLKNYNTDFQFYITTKISKPHYSPEICVKVNMINFMVTPEGLLDQITSVIVQIEDAKKAEAREKCINSKAENDKRIKEL